MHLSLSLSLSLFACVLFFVCCQRKQQAMLDTNIKHRPTKSSTSPQAVRDSKCLWYPRCLHVRVPNRTSDNSALTSLSPLSACVCKCAGACARENTAVENVWKQTQAPSEISVLEEITVLLLKMCSTPCDILGWNAWGWLIPSTASQSSAAVNTVYLVENITSSAQEQHLISHAQSKDGTATHA